MSSFKGYRSHDLPADDSVLRNLENLTRQDIEDALRLSMSPSARTRVLNRLHNRQHRNEAKMIPAWYLTSMGFEPMAEIELMLEDSMAHGQITNAVDVQYKYQNNRDVAITVYDPKVRQEYTFVVKRDDEVRIWKKPDARTSEKVDYSNLPSHGYMPAEHIAAHLDSFFGKMMSIKFKGGGRLTSMGTQGDSPDTYFFTFDSGQRVRVGGKELVHVQREAAPPGVVVNHRPWTKPPARQMPRSTNPFGRVRPLSTAYHRLADVPYDPPIYQGDSWWYFNNRSYTGKVVQLGSGDPAKSGVKGTCTQVTYENGKLIFVIDGFMYKRNRHTMVKVWDKKANA